MWRRARQLPPPGCKEPTLQVRRSGPNGASFGRTDGFLPTIIRYSSGQYSLALYLVRILPLTNPASLMTRCSRRSLR